MRVQIKEGFDLRNLGLIVEARSFVGISGLGGFEVRVLVLPQRRFGSIEFGGASTSGARVYTPAWFQVNGKSGIPENQR